MGCKQLFVNLGVPATTGLLQMAGGVGLDSTLRFVEDQSGADSILKLSTTDLQINGGTIITGSWNRTLQLVSTYPTIMMKSGSQYGGLGYDGTMYFWLGGTTDTNYSAGPVFYIGSAGTVVGSGTITQNGALTVKGAGGNITSFRNSSNVEQVSVANDGIIRTTAFFSSLAGSDAIIFDNGTGNIRFEKIGNYSFKVNLYNGTTGNEVIRFVAGTGGGQGSTQVTGLLQFGGNSSTKPAISDSTEYLHFLKADNASGYTGFKSGEGTQYAISVKKSAANIAALGFFDTTEITQVTTSIGEAALTSNGGTTITDTDTFDGYTLQQIVKGLRDYGLLQ